MSPTTTPGEGPPDVGPEAGDDGPLSADEVFHLLQSERRRRALSYLRGHGEVEMREVAEHVAADEEGTTVAQLDSDDRQRVYIALYQSHLPKLDDAGVVDYDQDRGDVERTPLADQLDPHLELVGELPFGAPATAADRPAAPTAGDPTATGSDADAERDPRRASLPVDGVSLAGALVASASWWWVLTSASVWRLLEVSRLAVVSVLLGAFTALALTDWLEAVR